MSPLWRICLRPFSGSSPAAKRPIAVIVIISRRRRKFQFNGGLAWYVVCTFGRCPPAHDSLFVSAESPGQRRGTSSSTVATIISDVRNIVKNATSGSVQDARDEAVAGLKSGATEHSRGSGRLKRPRDSSGAAAGSSKRPRETSPAPARPSAPTKKATGKTGGRQQTQFGVSTRTASSIGYTAL